MLGVIIGAVVLGLVVVAIVVGIQQGWFGSAGASAAGAGALETSRPRPPLAEFHVRDQDALVYFDVPLPDGPPDEVLRDLLLHEAVEVVREKRHDLPISQVTKVIAHGKRDGEAAVVGEVRLETPGELPPPVLPEHAAHASRVSLDLSSALASPPAAKPGVAAAPRAEQRLGPIAAELRLTGGLESGLRAQGLDPAQMSAGDLVLGILRMTGHVVAAGPAADTMYATKGGERTMVRIVDHLPDDHPELSEKEIRRFMVDFGSSGARRGLLVTDKYSPFMVYERERRSHVRFLSRERLQHFVDAVAVS